jgi:hypothetical protein
MKYILFFALSFISLRAFSQQQGLIGTITLPAPPQPDFIDGIARNGVQLLVTHNDTVKIFNLDSLHFIQIGNTTYRIVQHDPTIEVVEPPKGFLLPSSGTVTSFFGSCQCIPAITNQLQLPGN